MNRERIQKINDLLVQNYRINNDKIENNLNKVAFLLVF